MSPAFAWRIAVRYFRSRRRVGSPLFSVAGIAAGIMTLTAVLDALEAQYPMLRGTIRDHVTKRRRPFIRFFACEQDLSHQPTDTPLPVEVATGAEPLVIVGAMAGG